MSDTGSDRGLEYLDPDSLSLDWGVLMFGALLTGGVGVVFGILPALQAARTNPAAALMGGGASLTTALSGKFASCFLRVKRSSCAAAMTSPSSISAAALS